MQIITSGSVGIDQGTAILFSHFDTDGEMWSGSGDREVRTPVMFSQTFAKPPQVITYPCMWDADTMINMRMDIFADTISKDGFEIVFRTWSDSRIARVRAVWQAIGAIHDDDLWDLASINS
ncbi:MAG: H-type lectin domain-containing protein [Pseudomonadota bacterium]